MQLAYHHVCVQLQISNLNFLQLDTDVICVSISFSSFERLYKGFRSGKVLKR